MAGIGLVGAAGGQAAYRTLEDIITARQKEQLLAQAEVDRQRQLALQEYEAQQQAEQNRLTNERLFRTTEEAQKEKARTNLEQLAGRIKENTGIGEAFRPQDVVTLQQAGEGGIIKGSPITQLPSLIGRLGGTPEPSTETGGELVSGGTAAQRHQQQQDLIAQERAEQQAKRDAQTAAHQAVIEGHLGTVEEQTNRRLDQVDTRLAKTGEAQPLTPLQKITQTRLLANDWNRYTMPQRIMERQLGTMEAAIKQVDAGRPFGADEAILVSFERALDPNSVVRESEYARAGGGMAVLDQLQGMVKRARSGGAAVPPALLHQIVDLSRQFAAAERAYNQRERQRITDVATSIGIEPKNVFGVDVQVSPPGAAPAATPGASAPATRMPGEGYRIVPQ
jgi:hypothetical protein